MKGLFIYINLNRQVQRKKNNIKINVFIKYYLYK